MMKPGMVITLSLSLLALQPFQTRAQRRLPGQSRQRFVLDQIQASHFARLALRCARREYQNKIEHVVNDESDVKPPKSLHPAFYGCYDWHSSVHGHWLLAHLLRLYPALPEAGEIRETLNANLTIDNIKVEDAYFKVAGRQSFERPSIWALE